MEHIQKDIRPLDSVQKVLNFEYDTNKKDTAH